jgi:hypothetical protein
LRGIPRSVDVLASLTANRRKSARHDYVLTNLAFNSNAFMALMDKKERQLKRALNIYSTPLYIDSLYSAD